MTAAIRKADQSELCRGAIIYAARECEQSLRLAQFADSESTLSDGLAIGLRKLAAYHSGNAFVASRQLEALS